MEQQPTTQPTAPKQKSMLARIGIVASIVVALAVIVISVFYLVNPNGIETPNDEADNAVVITDTTVEPSVIQISAGETVTWINEGTTSRRLVATANEAGQALEGFGADETFGQGESYSFTFDKAGTFTYEDVQDPEAIKGTVIVE